MKLCCNHVILVFVPLFIIMLTGCVNTRDPLTCQLSRENDKILSCKDIQIEYNANTKIATAKIKKNDDDDVQDAIIGTLIWPGLADFKNADGIEGNALLDRNINLYTIAESKECDTSKLLPQPERYD